LYDSGCRIGEALGLRHEDIAAAERQVRITPRDNANRARSKSRAERVIPVSAGLIRLYGDYLHAEYGDVESDYVFVNLFAEARRPRQAAAGCWSSWSLPCARSSGPACSPSPLPIRSSAARNARLRAASARRAAGACARAVSTGGPMRAVLRWRSLPPPRSRGAGSSRTSAAG